jgi:hypothetical protein
MKSYLAFFTGLILFAPAAMPAVPNPAGLWEGSLATPNGDLVFVFNLHRDGDKWAGEMDVPMQHVSGLPLANIKVDGVSIGFPMPGQGDPHYDGRLSEDGKTIAGNLTAGGEPLPLNLKWKSEPRAVEKPPANSGDVQVLEGVWEGMIETHGMQLHLRFNFIKNADGSISATLDSLDQGANGLPVASISRSGDTVKLDIKSIGGSYEGVLSKDASTMTGTFTQGDGIPLTLQRKKVAAKN